MPAVFFCPPRPFRAFKSFFDRKCPKYFFIASSSAHIIISNSKFSRKRLFVSSYLLSWWKKVGHRFLRLSWACKDEQFVKCLQNLLCPHLFFLKNLFRVLSFFLNIQKKNHSKCDEKICIFYVCLCFHSEFANFHCFLKVTKLIFFLTHFKFEGEKIATAKTNMNF